MRRSHHKLSSLNLIEDKKSGEYKLSHHIDLNPVIITEKNFRYLRSIYVKKNFHCD